MGKDIQKWADKYKETKETWLADVDAIIENACRQGHLIQNSKGGFEPRNDSSKEIFLLSLDFRQLGPEDPSSTDQMLQRIQKHGLQRYKNCCKAVRFSSLCFWYSYIDVDQSNKIQRKGSDIGDIYHISLLPYCRIYTIDKTMHRVLQRIRAEATWGKCEVVTSDNLSRLLICK
jgi:hypothetical protein